MWRGDKFDPFLGHSMFEFCVETRCILDFFLFAIKESHFSVFQNLGVIDDCFCNL